jgi:hypothetical protein
VSDTEISKRLLERYTSTIIGLERAIDRCPSDLWNRSAEHEPYWYLVYHALFFLDLHLSDSPKGFRPPRPIVALGVDFVGTGHSKPYSKHELKGYINYVRRKASAKLTLLTEEEAGRPCGFPWLALTIEGLLIYTQQQVNGCLQNINSILDEEGR